MKLYTIFFLISLIFNTAWMVASDNCADTSAPTISTYVVPAITSPLVLAQCLYHLVQDSGLHIAEYLDAPPELVRSYLIPTKSIQPPADENESLRLHQIQPKIFPQADVAAGEIMKVTGSASHKFQLIEILLPNKMPLTPIFRECISQVRALSRNASSSSSSVSSSPAQALAAPSSLSHS